MRVAVSQVVCVDFTMLFRIFALCLCLIAPLGVSSAEADTDTAVVVAESGRQKLYENEIEKQYQQFCDEHLELCGLFGKK